MNKIALCRVSDAEPLVSIAVMLESAGYTVVLPDRSFRDHLRDIGCSNVDNFDDMHRRWGAEMPDARFEEVPIDILRTCELYVDVAGCRNGHLLRKSYPRLEGRILTYFINGGAPRITEDKGDNVTPANPIVTTAQWYRHKYWCGNKEGHHGIGANDYHSQNEKICSKCGARLQPAPWGDKVYVHYPPFTKWDRVKPREQHSYTAPISFVHNSLTWGCGHLRDFARSLGVKDYGGGTSLDGMMSHEQVFDILASALCVVYLKTGGAVDYSMLEAMATGTPFTCHEGYYNGVKCYELLEPDVTCLLWNDEASMARAVERLRSPDFNRQIGEAGKLRVQSVLWGKERLSDVVGFGRWMERNFPHGR